MGFRRAERLVRSTVLAVPFTATNLSTKYEVHGRENLERALAERASRGTGLVTISNHQSLFDDPMVIEELLGIRHFTVESKIWWSTPCEHNFSPAGSSPKDRFVRYFSDVSNMVFFARPGKNGQTVNPVEEYGPLLQRRAGSAFVERLSRAAAAAGEDLETWLARFVTEGDSTRMAALNQVGMIEAIARISTGDWLHFFPEGGRSRTLQLRDPKRGVGKVIYHCEEATVLPICFYGMHDVLPIKSLVPRPFQRVVVSIGEPMDGRNFDFLRRRPATPETFQTVVEAAWEGVTALRPATLARYMGPTKAADLLRAEAPAAFEPAGEAMRRPAQDRGQEDRRAPHAVGF